MNKIWMRNIAFLKKYFADFHSKSTSAEFNCPDLQITNCDDDNLTLRREQSICFLHSKYNVEREMQELFKETDDPEQVLIIFGMGMGYCLDYIQAHNIKYRQILIIEPYNNIFQELLKRRDLESLLKKKNVSMSIFNDARQILTQIMGQVMSSRKVKFLFHLSYRSIFDDIYQEISRNFIDEKRIMLISRTTINYFLQEWTANQLISIAQKQPGAAFFNGKLKDIPAVIVAAGPSLEKRIDELKEIQDKALIIAPGTGAKICSRRGIKAHLAMAMDSQKAEADLFKNCIIDILIGSYRLHPEVDKVFKHKLFRMTLNNEFIAQYYHYYFKLPADTISDHASVATTAIDFAVKLGCNPIILVGQDMCYYDNKVHADESKDSLPDKQTKIMQRMTDINGDTVYTTSPFLALRRDIEITNLRYQTTHTIINASEAGLGIPGVDNQKFREIIEHYIAPRKNDVKRIISSCVDDLSEDDMYTNLDIDAFYQHVLQEIEILERLNNEKLLALKELQKGLQRDLKENRLDSHMEIIRLKNQQLDNNPFYKTVVERMLNHFLIYYKAGTLYSFDGEFGTAEAQLYYESNVYDMSSRYLNIIRRITENLVNGIDISMYEDGNINIPVNRHDEDYAAELTLNFEKSDDEQEKSITLDFNNQ